MSEARIGAFARLANGDVAPVRVIEGQKTDLSRTMHGIAYDPVRDQIIVPVALAAAVLVFRGGANGEEAPVRVIQGPHTRLIRPNSVGVDPKRGEIYAVDVSRNSILEYAAGANGDATPIRELHGPKTGLYDVAGVCVDPIADKVVVTSSSRLPGGKTGLFIFNRTDNGDVPPQAVIAGPHTGIVREIDEVACDPQDGTIFAGVENPPHFFGGGKAYNLAKLIPGANPFAEKRAPRGASHGPGPFTGVWNITDNGDVPPRAWIRRSWMLAGGDTHYDDGVAIDPAHGEVFSTANNAIYTYSVPQFFKNLAGGGQSPN